LRTDVAVMYACGLPEVHADHSQAHLRNREQNQPLSYNLGLHPTLNMLTFCFYSSFWGKSTSGVAMARRSTWWLTDSRRVARRGRPHEPSSRFFIDAKIGCGGGHGGVDGRRTCPMRKRLSDLSESSPITQGYPTV
jgi:hypothetical protein